jgi:hypothetical protein
MNAYMVNKKGSMMTDVSTFRLSLLRAGYLLPVVGLGSTIWPAILDNTTTWELQRVVVVSMLGAMSVLCSRTRGADIICGKTPAKLLLPPILG